MGVNWSYCGNILQYVHTCVIVLKLIKCSMSSIYLNETGEKEKKECGSVFLRQDILRIISDLVFLLHMLLKHLF